MRVHFFAAASSAGVCLSCSGAAVGDQPAPRSSVTMRATSASSWPNRTASQIAASPRGHASGRTPWSSAVLMKSKLLPTRAQRRRSSGRDESRMSAPAASSRASAASLSYCAARDTAASRAAVSGALGACTPAAIAGTFARAPMPPTRKPTRRATAPTTKKTAKPTKKIAKPAKKIAKPAMKIAKPAMKIAKPAMKIAKTAAKKLTKTAAKKLTKTAAKKLTKTATSTAANELARRGERATAAARRIVAWFRAHAADDRRSNPPAGASASSLSALSRALGVDLPPDLVAWWRLHDGGVSIFEYEGLSCAASRGRRAGMEELRRDGVLADHELFPQTVARIARTKWHPLWIPLAEDGCGNLYCVDMGPGRMGVVGQVIRWEMRGGAFAASSVVLAELLERYADALESGAFTFDDGMFDGPFLDLLEPGPNSRPVRRR